MIDFSVYFSSDEKPEVELCLDTYLVDALARKIKLIREYYGPDRDIGPIRIRVAHDETNIVIATQKQGDQEYVLDELGILRRSDHG